MKDITTLKALAFDTQTKRDVATARPSQMPTGLSALCVCMCVYVYAYVKENKR